MSRIPTPADIAAAPEHSRPLLEGVQKKIGMVPNMYRLVSNSPATLEGLLALNGALSKSTLGGAITERIALAVANHNGCTYCNSAHTFLARNVAKLDDGEIAAARTGNASDLKASYALKFAQDIIRERGRVSEEDVRRARSAGFNDAELVEIVAHVALNTLTNYLNEVFDTEVDFPKLDAARAA